MNIIKVDDETYRRLSAVARMDQISPEEEAAQLLRSAIDQRQERLALVAEFRRIAAMTPKDVVQTDSVLLLREDRDR